MAVMTIDDASAYFGSDAELSRQLGFPYQSTVSEWRRAGKLLVPELYARRLAEMTKGRTKNGIVLKFDQSAYRIAS